MYGVQITFDNGNEPVSRLHMSRREYGDEMIKWQMDYHLKIERTEEFSSGDVLIFYKAYDRKTSLSLREVAKARKA